MNKYYGKLLSLAIGAASLETGCLVDSTSCRFEGQGDVLVNSAPELLQACKENRQRMFSCIIIPDGINESAYATKISCNSSNLVQLAEELSNTDFAKCQGSSRPNQVTAVCTD